MQLSTLCEIVEKARLKRAIITIDTNKDNVSVIVNIPTASDAKAVKPSKLLAALSTPLVINGNIAEIDVAFDEKLQEYGDAFAPAAISYNPLNSNSSTATKALKEATTKALKTATPAKQKKTAKKETTKSKNESAKTAGKSLCDATPEVKTPAFETTPTIEEKAPAPAATAAPAVEEKAPAPKATAAPAVEEKAPAPEATAAPAIEDKAPAPAASIAPAVVEDTPAPVASVAPAVVEDTPVVDEKNNDPQSTLEKQQSEMFGFFNFNF